MQIGRVEGSPPDHSAISDTAGDGTASDLGAGKSEAAQALSRSRGDDSMSFNERIHRSVEFEKRVIQHLNEIGWFAYQFGQAQLPDECRKRLIRFEDGCRRPSMIRWMADIITFRDMPSGRSFVALIDAKARSETVNVSIEMSAIEAAEISTDKLYTPTFFVFDDDEWGVLTPREARQRGFPGPRPAPSRGSGTPYLLIPKIFLRPFTEIFPQTRPMARSAS